MYNVEMILPKIKEYLQLKDNERTSNLIHELSDVKSRGYLTAEELQKIGMWKTPRQKRNVKSNADEFVVEISKKAFAEKDESKKIEYLNNFKGVSYPTSSAILMLTDPQNYGVIDIRAWQTLVKFEVVNTNQEGKAFKSEEWYIYLDIIRQLAQKFNVRARNIDLILFKIHQDLIQSGNLYKN
jgi:thermostable 8-oxoguanine DNA glycosylase